MGVEGLFVSRLRVGCSLLIAIEVTLHYGNRYNKQKRLAENGRGKPIHPLMEAPKEPFPYGILHFVAEAGLEPATSSL